MQFHNLYSMLFENSVFRQYSCLMLDLGFLQAEVDRMQKDIDQEDVYDHAGFGLEKEFHCTILYGIHESKPSEVLSKLELKPVKLKIKGLSLFKNESYDVLKFEIESKDLTTLNKKIRDNFAYTSSYQDYKAHATVAYLQKGMGSYYTKLKNSIKGKEYTSNTFIFSNPSGEKVFHKCK